MSVQVPLSTVSPRSYRRASLADFVAVVVWTGVDYVTVNSPVQAFFPSGGGLTVQGAYGSNTTVVSRDLSASVVAAFHRDTTRSTFNEGGIDFV